MRELVTLLLQEAPTFDKPILNRVNGLQFLFFHAGLKLAWKGNFSALNRKKLEFQEQMQNKNHPAFGI